MVLDMCRRFLPNHADVIDSATLVPLTQREDEEVVLKSVEGDETLLEAKVSDGRLSGLKGQFCSCFNNLSFPLDVG